MHRSRGILVAACLLTSVAACSSTTTAQPPPTSTPAAAPAKTSAPASTTPSTPPPPSSPEKITAACPLLTVPEISQSEGAVLDFVAEESEPKKVGAGKTYRCSYWGSGDDKSSGESINQLLVVAIPGAAPPKAMTDKLLKDCQEPPTPIPGVGETASYCQSQANAKMLVVGKRDHGETRVASLFLSRARDDVYVELAGILADRM